VAGWEDDPVPHHAIRDPEQILRRITEAACRLTGARYGALGVIDPDGSGLSDFIHVGMEEAVVEKIGDPPVGEGILGVLILDPRPLRSADLTAHPDACGFPPGHPPMRSFLGVPLAVRGEVFGNLYLTDKQGAAGFSAEDESLVVALAAAAGIAVNNSHMQLRLGALRLAEERERIARDLHDSVIQRLFATGLSLQSVIPGIADPGVRGRLEEAVSSLDDTIREVRTTIFALEPPSVANGAIRSQVLRVCAEAAESLGSEPEVRFVGAVDRQVTPAIATQLLPTLREALSNVVRHSGAGHAEVELSVGDEVRLRVTDDGSGPEMEADGPEQRGRGLANMAGRAAALGGSMTLSAGREGGAELVWEVPLEPR
jgi:signal transduction histidine kinase